MTLEKRWTQCGQRKIAGNAFIQCLMTDDSQVLQTFAMQQRKRRGPDPVSFSQQNHNWTCNQNIFAPGPGFPLLSQNFFRLFPEIFVHFPDHFSKITIPEISLIIKDKKHKISGL